MYNEILEKHFILDKGLTKDAYFNSPEPEIYNLKNVAEEIRKAILENKTFKVMGDYDTDGIFSTYILVRGLRILGANVTYRLPCRYDDGYGLSENIVNEISEDIIITVDNGISALDAVKKAKGMGKTVYVIDHHEPVMKDDKPLLPDADLIIDHKVYDGCNTPYCGAGLAYRLMKELICNEYAIKEFTICAAIATIADVVPLVFDNRNIVIRGLELLNNKKNWQYTPRGIRKIMAAKNIYFADEETLAWYIVPVFNAPGRMLKRGAEMALEMLLEKNDAVIDEMAAKLIEVNNRRMEMTSSGVDNAVKEINDNCLYGDIIVVLYDGVEPISEGICGIIAGRLQELYGVPIGMFTKTDTNGEVVYKGSFRSEKYDIKKILDEVQKKSNTLYKYGGHAKAAGATIRDNDTELFIETLQELDISNYILAEKKGDDFCIEMESSDVTSFYEELKIYAPFGEGNRIPKIKVKNVSLIPYMGKTYSLSGTDTLKLNGDNFSMVGFKMYKKYESAGFPQRMNVTGKLSVEHFRNKENLKLTLEDFETVKTVKKETTLGAALRARMAAL